MIPGARGDTGDTVVKGAIGMDLEKRICDVCGYIYDPEEGDPTPVSYTHLTLPTN